MGRAVLIILILLSTPSMADQTFSPEAIAGWQHHSFAGKTDYELVTVDGREAVRATCKAGTASGLYLEESINLDETPIIEWRWRVESVYSGIDERSRDGDDFPARIYAVHEPTWLRWKTRALNYVWASTEPEGSSWTNPFQSRARMIAVDSGKAGGENQWQTVTRNLRADFKEQHGEVPERITALAIMTDCDNHKGQTRAWYGRIQLRSAGNRVAD
ncbi:DUF3047 domain-containing protein [Salicola sp. Rm-C-2C1-2]|uniref:DUF3047 domain-containing protein n=1 Tax=Salicola sp. Rm-C-2C1-2 TaxID=3141321 RepID=UPI0032E4829B